MKTFSGSNYFRMNRLNHAYFHSKTLKNAKESYFGPSPSCWHITMVEPYKSNNNFVSVILLMPTFLLVMRESLIFSVVPLPDSSIVLFSAVIKNKASWTRNQRILPQISGDQVGVLSVFLCTCSLKFTSFKPPKFIIFNFWPIKY